MPPPTSMRSTTRPAASNNSGNDPVITSNTNPSMPPAFSSGQMASAFQNGPNGVGVSSLAAASSASSASSARPVYDVAANMTFKDMIVDMYRLNCGISKPDLDRLKTILIRNNEDIPMYILSFIEGVFSSHSKKDDWSSRLKAALMSEPSLRSVGLDRLNILAESKLDYTGGISNWGDSTVFTNYDYIKVKYNLQGIPPGQLEEEHRFLLYVQGNIERCKNSFEREKAKLPPRYGYSDVSMFQILRGVFRAATGNLSKPTDKQYDELSRKIYTCENLLKYIGIVDTILRGRNLVTTKGTLMGGRRTIRRTRSKPAKSYKKRGARRRTGKARA
jgi:hypothetical protein